MAAVKLNGKKLSVPDNFSIEELLKQRKIAPESVIVAHNDAIVNSSNLAAVKLKDADEIEILRFVAGG
ncbi:MAG: sulfur carrier protein ThiS [Endomicrobium sp.]|jgi:sulfur carrier protein|nr:sulfur carrier protein ThiS [Endomicrobium sp.]